MTRDCPVKYPAKYGAVLAVAATDYNNQQAAYSPKGDELDLSAPGGDGSYPILSTWPAEIIELCPIGGRLLEGDGYCKDYGTSMAAGVATGAAALAWSVRPNLDAEEVRDLLEESTRPLLDADDEVGDGLVDADSAVRYALRSRLDVAPADTRFWADGGYGELRNDAPVGESKPGASDVADYGYERH